MITRYIGMRTLKTAIGAAVAIFVAQIFGLDYGVNTAIVVILSLQNTKRKSLNLAGVRILSTLIALMIAWAVFSIVGFNAAAFGMYLLLFIPIVVRLKLNEGLVPSSVLVSHLLASHSVAFPALLNEFAQMVIGASIALVLNLYIPGIERHIRADLVMIKRLKFDIIQNMADIFAKGKSDKKTYDMLIELNDRIKLATSRVMRDYGDNYNMGMEFYIRYLQMESDHLDILNNMDRHMKIFISSETESKIAAEYTENVISVLKQNELKTNDAEFLKSFIKSYSKEFCENSTDGFRYKAALLEYLTDLHKLLEIVLSFRNTLVYSDRKLFRELRN
ncbi:MAG: aromatic acid exporter family protein [Gudongella sp.]|jgi:uncharacterized membrane protein YgaE (UPF0421/DUF939 family)|nr:aromatic acid exporter family protein [Gudongella sp.]